MNGEAQVTITQWPFIYTYATNRDDFPYAVGVMQENEQPDGAVALLNSKANAELFALALQQSTGGTLSYAQQG